MPILVRPVREQLEHDKVIRLLQAKLKKKYAAEANPGEQRNVPFKVRGMTLFPDLVLTASADGRKAQAVVEVETVESLNHLEAMAQWTHFGQARAGFHLYVPVNAVDVAKRLLQQFGVTVTELWSYYSMGDSVRFLPVYRARSGESSAVVARRTRSAGPAAKSRATQSARPAALPRTNAASPRRARPTTTRSRPAATTRRAAKSPARTAGVRTTKATRTAKAVRSTPKARAAKKRRS